jgi:hypothetical protein
MSDSEQAPAENETPETTADADTGEAGTEDTPETPAE